MYYRSRLWQPRDVVGAASEMFAQMDRKPKDLRYREHCFPEASSEILHTKNGGFAPIAGVGRLLLRHLQNSELRVWVYLQLRAGPYCITYPTYEQIARDTGLKSRGTVSKAVRALEAKGFVRTHDDNGVRRYLIRDPKWAAKHLWESGSMSDSQLAELNDLLETLGQVPIDGKKQKAAVA